MHSFTFVFTRLHSFTTRFLLVCIRLHPFALVSPFSINDIMVYRNSLFRIVTAAVRPAACGGFILTLIIFKPQKQPSRQFFQYMFFFQEQPFKETLFSHRTDNIFSGIFVRRTDTVILGDPSYLSSTYYFLRGSLFYLSNRCLFPRILSIFYSNTY